jgi:cysteine synthase
VIDLEINEAQLQRTIQRCRERNIIIPTLAEQKDPDLVPAKIKQELRKVGLWEVNPRNLFRITWKNEPVAKGGGFKGLNFFELPSELTGVEARIVALVGKWFPTGSHKVGATFGCLVPRLVTGQFDPTFQKAVWPSTGNYCRGGAYNAALLACESIAILPEEMSQERFDWLKTVAGEIIATPGCESNVKEIYDKCWELRATREDVVIFNQFDEFGNHLWHYEVTGHAMEELVRQIAGTEDRVAAIALTTGSAGTIGCGDYLRQLFPTVKIVASEARQCPTLLYNGYGGHRIEGIGDKHIPWIHNVRNTDMVVAIDDRDTMSILPLFNDPIGQEFLSKRGIPDTVVSNLCLLGISSIANLLTAIKIAKYYELSHRDLILTVFTDSMELYGSRLREYYQREGEYSNVKAERDFHCHVLGQGIDFVQELSYWDRKRIHNLKYFTWVEQQGKTVAELNAQWYEQENYWGSIHALTPQIDRLIHDFNQVTGLL